MSRTKSERVTLSDVAKAAGVSKAAASLILNGKTSALTLAAQTTSKVLAAARQLNYQPDQVAQALAMQKNQILSLLVLSPWLHNQFSDFTAQMNAEIKAYSERFKLRLTNEYYSRGKLAKVLTARRAAKYDAVLLVGTNAADNAFLERNTGRFSNIIVLNRNLSGILSSYGNDFEATRSMAGRIAAPRYYRRYILVSRSTGTTECEKLRLDGFLAGLKESAVPPETIERTAFSPEAEGKVLSQSLLREFGHDRVCCFFPQYQEAAKLLTDAIRAGLQVPEGIGICAFDRHSLLENFLVQDLVTIDSRIGEMTRNALDMAMELKQHRPCGSRMVEGFFVDGSTVLYR